MSGKLILNLKRKRSVLESISSEHKPKIPNLQEAKHEVESNFIKSSAADGQIINQCNRGVVGNESSKPETYLGPYKPHISENDLENSKVSNAISIRNINDINNDMSLYYNQQNNGKFRENINNFSEISKNNNNGNEFVQQSRHSPEKLDAICLKIANVCQGQQQRPRSLNQRLRTENHARVFKNDNINKQHIIDNHYGTARHENVVQEQASDNRSRADFLKLALERLNELQEELCNDEYDSEDEDDDDDIALFENSPETLGYAVCVKETMAYLAAQGMTPDNPLIINLRNSLIDALPM